MITIPIEPAPSTPLNLQIGIAYAPRVASPPWAAYRVVWGPESCLTIEGFDQDGGRVDLYHYPNGEGATGMCYRKFAILLRMDHPAPTPGVKPPIGTSKP